ncbi:MAG: Tex family protein [Burkholderiaceae bacterium]
MIERIITQLAQEVAHPADKVRMAIALLDEGATVPFIARYRKEVTGGMDDTQLRLLAERLTYLRELEERRAAVLEEIEKQGKLDDALKAQILAADSKQRLEDLYAPFKPKRRTRAQIAIEAGLLPLAEALVSDRSLVPADEAAKYLNAEAKIETVKAALDGARDILAERFSEDPDLVTGLRDALWASAELASSVAEDKRKEIGADAERFSDYFDHRELLSKCPSHRALAMLRGRNLGLLRLAIDLPAEQLEGLTKHPYEGRITAQLKLNIGTQPADSFIADCVRWAWRVKLHPTLESDCVTKLREAAELEAIRVFGTNLRDVLLAPPAGHAATMGLDPGIRTGVKVAVIDATGKLLDTATIYPHEPRRDWDGSLHTLAALAHKHNVKLIAIGNGTASRETDKLAADLIKLAPQAGIRKVVVSEAGASVYSASEFASQEFPQLDVSLRGAVSIARRLQDPLAELVKIDPKSIGVGQYQHDVNQRQLSQQLDAVVEDCVNAVGVDVNTASAPLLARVSGLSSTTAKAIVTHRDAHGAFASRDALRKVPRLGDKTFEQCAGFLRVPAGENPLDASAVHPEAYPVVERILAKVGKPLTEVMGRADVLKSLAPKEFADEKFGIPTVQDILLELAKPGRDPRGEFAYATFDDSVQDIKDLKEGMKLEGVVTNVAAFGAFVDIGVHQDGLVHVSELADRFVKDPREVVKAGQKVTVRVVEVDVPRKRIALSMKTQSAGQNTQGKPASTQVPSASSGKNGSKPASNMRGAPSNAVQNSAMADAFAKLRKP